MKTPGSAYGHRESIKPKTGDRVKAKHFNFDGRHTDPEAGVWEPDVDDPTEDLHGTLIVQKVESAFGDRTDYLVKLDNGAVRFVEPATIMVAREIQ